MSAPQAKAGGSFAPPITPEVLAAYKALAPDPLTEVGSHFAALIKMVEVFQETPESTETAIPHPSGTGEIVPLKKDEVKRIWDHVPWPSECDAMGRSFDALTGDKRNAAYHLLWYARELTLDREPITTDKL